MKHALWFVLALICLRSHGQQLQKPNVLLIMVDDLRPELGCYGKKHMVTPHIDRLAAMGQMFTRAYTNFPTCGPSRASLLSGLYPSRHRFNTWNCSQDKDTPGVVSLPMHFRNNHYQTISLGKVYNNLDDGQGSWDEVWRPVINSTEPIAWEYLSKAGKEAFESINAERLQNTKQRTSDNLPKKGFAFERPDVADNAYMDGKTTDKTIETLQQLRLNPSQPFFLTVGFYKPHWPFNAPDKYWRLYDPEKIELPKNQSFPKNAPEMMSLNQGGLRTHLGLPDKGQIPDSTAKNLLHGFYACISYIDSQVGKILNTLEYLGMDENTIVILWGDQGQVMGEHGLWVKNNSFSSSLQIPLIMKTPGRKAGQQQGQLVESIDIFPTLCELAGITKPFHLQGKSFVPVLNDVQAPGKEAVFSRAPLEAETVITQNHVYTQFYDHKKKVKASALFDLRVDPDESNNIAAESAQKEIVSELSKRLEKHLIDRDHIPLK